MTDYHAVIKAAVEARQKTGLLRKVMKEREERDVHQNQRYPGQMIEYPWNRGMLREWSIVGMNHFTIEGIRNLFVAMSKGGRCIKSEGDSEHAVWAELYHQAVKIHNSDHAGKSAPADDPRLKLGSIGAYALKAGRNKYVTERPVSVSSDWSTWRPVYLFHPLGLERGFAAIYPCYFDPAPPQTWAEIEVQCVETGLVSQATARLDLDYWSLYRVAVYDEPDRHYVARIRLLGEDDPKVRGVKLQLGID